MAERKSTRGRLEDGSANPIDIHVGARMRLRRTLLGLSQEKLGEAIGLTFQQVQKYERGANRIGCSRLFDLARALDVPVSFFFDDLPAEAAAASPAAVIAGTVAAVPRIEMDPIARQETMEIARDIVALPGHARASVRQIVRVLRDNFTPAQAAE
ncbi:helix-turn-helix domain-containing protein [Phaeospirillum tilakii]|uniref:Helix-turn-helix domain-containing protein n=1 Tax=Phaeospirillum tilakii TaxID=741673 RepID=A0ABW5CFP6_9PROT